jgi:hypothetical protein
MNFRNGKSWRQFSIALLVLLASILPVAASAQDTSKESEDRLVSQLTAIATASLYAQLDVLTNAVTASATQELAAHYQAAIQEKIAEATIRRAALLADGIIYGKYNLQVTILGLQVDENTAILHATEYTAIELENAKTDQLAPQTTEYVDEHTFHFQYTDGDWYLNADQVRMPLNTEIDPQLGPVTDPSSSVESNAIGKFSAYLPIAVATANDTSVQASGEEQILVDLNAVANYARKWWNSANPDYRNWLPDEDCTNFVSQSLKAGGWAYTTRWSSSKWWTSAWWYASDDQTRTWTASPWFYSFASNRAILAPRVSDLRVGDVLQIDWTGDGSVDHATIVTKKDARNNLYLTYHSNNRLDKPLSDIRTAYPNAKYYAWKLN